jgi:hypothetical protein
MEMNEEMDGIRTTTLAITPEILGLISQIDHIRQLHRDLLQYSTKDERHRGAYKTHTNHVETFGSDSARAQNSIPTETLAFKPSPGE